MEWDQETPPPAASRGNPEVTAEPAVVVSASPDLASRRRAEGSAWDLVAIVLTFIVSQTGAAIAFAVASHVYAARYHHPLWGQLPPETRLLVPAQVVGYLATFVLMYFIVTQLRGQPFWAGIHWRWPPGLGAIAKISFLGVLLAVLVGYLESILPMPAGMPMQRLFATPASAYMMGVLAVVVAPLMEELFFRGFLYQTLQRLGTFAAVTITALGFAALHGPQLGWSVSAVALLLLVGLVLTGARAWTGSVAPGYLIHLAYNSTQFAVTYLATDHFRHLERLGQ